MIGIRYRVQGTGFKVQGSRFRVQGSGFRVQGSGVQGFIICTLVLCYYINAKSLKADLKKIIGSILFFANGYWIIDSLHIFYLYRFTDVSFLYQIPEWILAIFIVFGSAGIFIALNIFRGDWKIKKGVIINLALCILGLVIENLRHY